MNDPRGDADVSISTVSRDGACDDVQLLRRIGQGDEDAMAAFYREHGRIVLAQVLLVTGERVLAEEIVQDTMLAIWRGAGSFRGESSVRSWVIAIARRQTRDRLRGQRLRGGPGGHLLGAPRGAVRVAGHQRGREDLGDGGAGGTGARCPGRGPGAGL